MLGHRCRFFPSCSHYATEAINSHGAAKGSFLAVKRVCKCHPFHPGGYDPVPSEEEIKMGSKIKTSFSNLIKKILKQEKTLNG